MADYGEKPKNESKPEAEDDTAPKKKGRRKKKKGGGQERARVVAGFW